MTLPTTIGSTSGADRILGTAGNDIIDGGSGNDIIRGGAGDDYIDGGANRDHLWGDEGNDTLDGGGSKDRLDGGSGDDTLFGGGQDDRVYGGIDSDKIIGGDGNDVLYGDNPDDGNDAEGYADTFFFDENDGSDQVHDFEVGLDTVNLGEGTSYTLSYNSDDTILTYGSTTVIFHGAVLTGTDILVAGDAGWEATPEILG